MKEKKKKKKNLHGFITGANRGLGLGLVKGSVAKLGHVNSSFFSSSLCLITMKEKKKKKKNLHGLV
jgi:hypothetical protein